MALLALNVAGDVVWIDYGCRVAIFILSTFIIVIPLVDLEKIVPFLIVVGELIEELKVVSGAAEPEHDRVVEVLLLRHRESELEAVSARELGIRGRCFEK